MGKLLTLTATGVAANGGDPPAGVVVFCNGTRKLGSANLDASEIATFASTKLKTGSHSIVARYQGRRGRDAVGLCSDRPDGDLRPRPQAAPEDFGVGAGGNSGRSPSSWKPQSKSLPSRRAG
jgi:Bacterial Ig-like domain (group 3)